jgi:hypothetical protein
MASKISSMISDTPPQTENSAIRQHLLIHLRRHELDQFPSNLQEILCWNRMLVHSKSLTQINLISILKAFIFNDK